MSEPPWKQTPMLEVLKTSTPQVRKAQSDVQSRHCVNRNPDPAKLYSPLIGLMYHFLQQSDSTWFSDTQFVRCDSTRA